MLKGHFTRSKQLQADFTTALRHSTCRLKLCTIFVLYSFDMPKGSTDPNNPHVFCSCYQLIDIDAMSSVAF